MLKQILAGMLGSMLAWSPIPDAATQASVVPGSFWTAPTAIKLQDKDPNLSYGSKAVDLVVEQVIQKLTDYCYDKHGGLFVSRRLIEKKVRAGVARHRQSIDRYIRSVFLDLNSVRFNTRTSELTYGPKRRIKTVSVGEIVDSIIRQQDL